MNADDEDLKQLNTSELDENGETKRTRILPIQPKFLHINLNGLKSRYTDLRDLLVNEANIIACAISETRLKAEDYTGQFNIFNFTFLRKDRLLKEGGGVGIYVNNCFDMEMIETDVNFSQIETLCVKISKAFFKPIILTTIYIPPDKVNEEMLLELQQLLSFLRKYDHELVL